ncbi:hypothetical protein CDAR_366561 [Caerostris darwini]|uniref:Uncharacterized protein n=1 Tax=Caerostris darwini TaxID=1538125 RepID=A0AAV4Q289_9ARAC|nr:hypothetical protein CDAR_366561 [Caerostris darwini]
MEGRAPTNKRKQKASLRFANSENPPRRAERFFKLMPPSIVGFGEIFPTLRLRLVPSSTAGGRQCTERERGRGQGKAWRLAVGSIRRCEELIARRQPPIGWLR